LGTYYQEPDVTIITVEEAQKIVQNAAGLDDNTMKYLSFYRYNDDLIKKLAIAITR